MSLTTTVSTKRVPRKSGGTGSLAGANPDRFAGVSWVTAFFTTLFHIGAVWALIDFTWSGVVVLLVTYYIALAWGIGMSYHRLLTHRAYKTPKFVEYFLTICATTALEGGALFWVATHRRHHQHSDSDMDPHTPRHGGFWAHMGWIIFGEAQHNNVTMTSKYAPDLSRDAFHVWLSKYHWVPLTIQGLVLWALGGWNWVLWGVFLRVTLGLHATWLVNSATHLWGKRRFLTRDDSRNNWWVALLTFGEGWHNNHHAHPTSAAHGLAWYEVDLTYMHIRALELVGLATDVRRVRVDDAIEEAA
jgi:fatty-acid desaturase